MSQESKHTATPQGTNTVALTTSKNHRLMVKANTSIADLDMIVDTRAMLSIISKLYRYNGLSFGAALVPSIFSE